MKELGVIACRHVLSGQRSVNLVVHTNDGFWQFLCGNTHQTLAGASAVGLNHLLEFDPSLAAVLDLPNDWYAERSKPGLVWRRASIE